MSRIAFNSPSIAACILLVATLVSPGSSELMLGAEICGEYGTSVVFADSPADAAWQALQEEKLVFVLHVSGHFEESNYT